MKQLTPTPVMQFLDFNGDPLSGGLVYTYEAGTTNPLATYTDATGVFANSNPVVLDSRGEAQIWLDEDTLYKFELRDADDVLIWTADDIGTPPNTSLTYVTLSDAQTITGVKTFDEAIIVQDMTIGAGNSTFSDTNTVVGKQAQSVFDFSNAVTAIGYRALFANSDGVSCTAVGASALEANTADNNTAVGAYALAANYGGEDNTAVGRQAMLINDAGSNNTAVGSQALSTNTSGDDNTAVGFGAANLISTGYSNTAVGKDAFSGSNTNFCIAIGEGALTATSYSSAIGLGNFTAVSGNDQVQLGPSGSTAFAYGAVQDRSDARDKADIRDTTLGLDFIKALRPVDFKWDMRDDYRQPMPKADGKTQSEYKAALAEWVKNNSLSKLSHDGSKKRKRYHHGLIAQEVAALNVDFGGLQHHAVNGGEDVYSIGYEELVAPLIKAVQELSAEVERLKNGS